MLCISRKPIFDLFSKITIDKDLSKLGEYETFLTRLGDRELTVRQGFNLHHILPRTFFKKNQISDSDGVRVNDKRNLILLTPYEHFLAHTLLVRIFPHHYGLNSYVARVFKFFGSLVDDPNFETVFTEVYNHSRQEIGKSFSYLMKRRWADPEIRQQYIQMGIAKWESHEYRAKVSGANAWFHSHKPRKGTR